MILRSLRATALAAAIAATCAVAQADSVMTVRDKSINGLIVYEDELKVTLRTDGYGELTFRKVDLKAITRSAESAPIVKAVVPIPFAGLGRPTPKTLPGAAPGTASAITPSAADPFAGAASGAPGSNPFATGVPPAGGNAFVSSTFVDPVATPAVTAPGGVVLRAGEDPFANRPAAQPPSEKAPNDPFAAAPPAGAPASGNPFAPPSSAPPSGGGMADPFSAIPMGAPASSDPFAAPPSSIATPAATPAPAASGNPFAQPPVASAAPTDPFAQPSGAAAVPPMGSPAATPTTPTASTTTPTSTPMVDAGGVPSMASVAAAVATAPIIKPGYDGAVYDIVPPTKPIQIIASDGAAPVEEAASALLKVGAHVKTRDSRAQLSLRGKADTLRMPEKSEVRLASMSANGDQVQIDVLSGSLWTDVAPRLAQGDFKVVTPDLTAGVKGTRFRIDVLPNRGTLLSVDEGAVEVVSKNAPVSKMVRQFEAVIVTVNGQLSDAIKLDPQVSRDAWGQWAEESANQVAANLTVGGDLIRPMFDQVAADNARWTEMVEEGNQTIAENKYMDQMDRISSAFMKLAEDTGHIAEDADAWNLLKDNRANLQGWNGPYIEGAIPPADPWQNCLVYRKRTAANGNVSAIIYSRWRDQVDSRGNQPGDRFVLVPYYQLNRTRTP